MSDALQVNSIDVDSMLNDVEAGVRVKRRCAVAVSIAGLALLFIAGRMAPISMIPCVTLALTGSAVWMGADLCKNIWTTAELRLKHVLATEERPEALRSVILRLDTPSDNARAVLLKTAGRLLTSFDDDTVTAIVDGRLCSILMSEVMRWHRAPFAAQSDYQAFVIGALRALRIHRYVRALPALRRILRADFSGGQMAVAAALADCVSELEAEVQRRAMSASLLRPGGRPESDASALLSPASSPYSTVQEHLLRSSAEDERNSTHN